MSSAILQVLGRPEILYVEGYGSGSWGGFPLKAKLERQGLGNGGGFGMSLEAGGREWGGKERGTREHRQRSQARTQAGSIFLGPLEPFAYKIEG